MGRWQAHPGTQCPRRLPPGPARPDQPGRPWPAGRRHAARPGPPTGGGRSARWRQLPLLHPAGARPRPAPVALGARVPRTGAPSRRAGPPAPSRLADAPAPEDTSVAPPTPQAVRPELTRLLDQWSEQAALLLGPYRDVLAANPLARARRQLRPRHKPDARGFPRSGRAIHLSRLGTRRHRRRGRAARLGGRGRPESQRDRLVLELSEGSPEFARLWERHEAREKPVGRQRFRTPTCADLNLPTQPFNCPRSWVWCSTSSSQQTTPTTPASSGR